MVVETEEPQGRDKQIQKYRYIQGDGKIYLDTGTERLKKEGRDSQKAEIGPEGHVSRDRNVVMDLQTERLKADERE